MFPENYTTKGKLIIGIYLISLLTIVIISGSYVVSYMSNKDIESNSEITTPSSTDVTPNSEMPEVTTNTNGENEISSEAGTEVNADSSSNTDTSIDVDENTEVELNTNTNADVSNTDSNTAGNNTAAHNNNSSNNENGTYSQEDLKILKEAYATLYFNFQSFELNENSTEILNSIIKVIKKYPDEYIVIEGHSDGFPNFENTAMESELSANRISVVIEKMLENGVNESKIITVNSGSTDPVSKKLEDRSKNDRVEIYFVDHTMKNTNGK